MKRALPIFCLLPVLAFGQNAAPATPNPASSLLANLRPRELGPTTMGGRVTSLAVYEKEPRIFLVGAAAGGIWKTENGGLTFNPIFTNQGSASIGDVAICQSDPNLIWVATGEGTSRNSVGWGDGIYKSTDGGKTWANLGLQGTYSFTKVVIDPKDKNTVYAGALGQTWGYNQDRGVYKTTDGGKTWQKTLYVDDKTGVADLVMNPSNHHELLAAMWQHLRLPYSFVSGGPGSGLYRSTDGGASWHQLHKGLPASPLGRIGLSYFHKDPHIVLATVEAKEGSGLYRSADGGETWAKISGLNPRPFYFSLPRQDPQEVNRIYEASTTIHVSENMGKSFDDMPSSVHVDHHAFWIDPSDNNHILIGEDGGVGQTLDRGKTWDHLNSMRIGQFYAVTFDMRKPYWVYGGLQDNGCWAGPTQTAHGGVTFWDFFTVNGGDGFHVQVDPNDWTTIYSESQGGALDRLDQKYGGSKSIAPRAPKGEKYRANWSTPFILSAWNSRTIYFGGNKLHKSVDRGDHWIAISPDLTRNNPAWQKPGEGSVSPEDTGAEVYDTIITISESPLKQGLLWVGTDDGLVQLTQDDGVHWTNVTANIKNLPSNTWVSRVAASRFAEGRAYATFDGHRSNDYKTYLYTTEDYGKTWTKLNANLPANEPCYVIKEGLKNPSLLMVGTEFSLYFSFDRGQSWTKFQAANWPTVPVHDLEIQPQSEDLLIATHGRSLWILHIGALDELTPENLQKDVYLAKPSNVYEFGNVQPRDTEGDRYWTAPNTQPGTSFFYYLKSDGKGNGLIKVTDAAGSRTVENFDAPLKAGLNAVSWLTPRRLAPGDYRVTLTIAGKDYTTSLRVEEVTDQQTSSPPRTLTTTATPPNDEEEQKAKPKSDDEPDSKG